MHFICRSFIGRPDNNSWSQYWENEPDDISIISHRGHLFGLTNLLSTDSVDVSALGHQLITDINQLYYSQTDTPIDSWLKNTLETVLRNPIYESLEISLSVAIVLNDRLSVAIYNSGQVIFCRDPKIAIILSSVPHEVVITSGQLIDQDRLFLCTDHFFNSFTLENIKLFLSGSQIQDIEENFLSHLYSLENQTKLAAALIIIHTDPVDNQIEEIILPPQPDFPKIASSNSTYTSSPDAVNHGFRKKNNIIFSLFILLILFISVFIGYKKNHSWQLENRYVTLKTNYQIKIDSATTVKNINLSTAQTLAKEAESILKEMATLNIHSDEVKKFQTSTQTLLSQTGSPETYHPELFYDTSIINNSPKFSQLTLFQNNLYLLDSTAGRIDKLDISNKSQNNIATADTIKNSQFIAENNDKLYLLKDKQIYSVSNSAIESKIKLTDDIPDFNSGTFHFWNGSLYLMAKTTTNSVNLWKYAPTATGFNKGAVWLKSNKTLPTDSSSFAINGQIWVITQKGLITPYSLGVAQDFNTSSTLTFDTVDNLVTSLDTDILAFTDKNSTVYVYKKSGDSAFSYNFNNLKILSLAFSQTTNTIFVLCEDQKIYKIGL